MNLYKAAFFVLLLGSVNFVVVVMYLSDISVLEVIATVILAIQIATLVPLLAYNPKEKRR